MADTLTTIWAMIEPEVGASADVWGSKLNSNFAFLDWIISAHATTGSANAYVFTTGFSVPAYVKGQKIHIIPNFTNTGAATINLDGLGAKNITKNGTTALASGDLVSGQTYTLIYDNTQWQVVGPLSGAFQTLNANLTALSGQTWAADQITYQTGAAAVANLAFPSASRTQIAAGLGTAAVMTGPSGTIVGTSDSQTLTNKTLTTPTINGAALSGTLSGTPNFSGNPVTFSNRPTFNGNTALDTANGIAQSATAAQTITNNSTSMVFRVTGSGSPYISVKDTNGNNELFLQAINGTGVGIGSISGGAQTDVLFYCASTEVGRLVGSGMQMRVAVSSETSGTLTSASSNKIVVTTAGVTINDGIHAANDQILIYNNSASPVTIAQDTGMTLRLDSTTTTGNRTLGPRGKMHVFLESNSEAVCSGMGVS